MTSDVIDNINSFKYYFTCHDSPILAVNLMNFYEFFEESLLGEFKIYFLSITTIISN